MTVQQAQDLAGAIAYDPDGQLTARGEVQLFKHYRLSCGEQDRRPGPMASKTSPAEPKTGGQMAGRAGKP
jgi:hypothetical protein